MNKMQDDNLQKTNNFSKESTSIRYGRGTLLILSMVINGFSFGAWLSARFIVSENSGLAGGAEVAFGGLVAAVTSVVISIIVLRRLNGKRVFQIMTVSVLTSLILIGIVTI